MFEKDAIFVTDPLHYAGWLGLVVFEKDAIFNSVPSVPSVELGLVEFEKDAIFLNSAYAFSLGWGL